MMLDKGMSAHHERALGGAGPAAAACRALEAARGLDFASNDYLGLAESPELLREAVADALARGVAVGAGGSRLLRGNSAEHEALEAEAAAFFGAETRAVFRRRIRRQHGDLLHAARSAATSSSTMS